MGFPEMETPNSGNPINSNISKIVFQLPLIITSSYESNTFFMLHLFEYKIYYQNIQNLEHFPADFIPFSKDIRINIKK